MEKFAMSDLFLGVLGGILTRTEATQHLDSLQLGKVGKFHGAPGSRITQRRLCSALQSRRYVIRDPV